MVPLYNCKFHYNSYDLYPYHYISYGNYGTQLPKGYILLIAVYSLYIFASCGAYSGAPSPAVGGGKLASGFAAMASRH